MPATPAAVPAGWHRFDAPTPGSSQPSQSQPQSLKTHAPGSNPEASARTPDAETRVGRDEFDELMKRFVT